MCKVCELKCKCPDTTIMCLDFILELYVVRSRIDRGLNLKRKVGDGADFRFEDHECVEPEPLQEVHRIQHDSE
ncbi:hypothetical protein JHK86_017349 [Glycine max]|nr:hypothetical protein JHK86_017349 [Glycine max]